MQTAPSLTELLSGDTSVPTERVREALECGADPSECDPDGTPVAFYALHNASTMSLQLILESGGQLQPAAGNATWNPLECALAQDGRELELIRLLLQHGADPSSEHDWMHSEMSSFETPTKSVVSSPLHRAAEKGIADACSLLLNHGAAPFLDLYEDGIWSPLHIAARDGHAEVARVLLKHGADPNANFEEYITLTPLDHAADEGRSAELISLLLKHGASPNIPTWMQLTAVDRAIETARRNADWSREVLPLILEAARKLPPPENARGQIRTPWPPVF